MIPPFDVFLCHGDEDKPAVEAVARRLVEIGIRPSGVGSPRISREPQPAELDDALESSRSCAVFLGAEADPWQNAAMRTAIERRLTAGGGSFRVIQVFLPGASMSKKGALAELIDTQGVEFRDTLADEDAFQQLVRGIRGVAPEPDLAAGLAARITTRTARVGIVGLGYVGLPLAVEFAQAGFDVTGFDVSEAKTVRVNGVDSYVGDVPNAALGPLVQAGKLRATTDFSMVREMDTINICVPTPLRKTKDPDMSYIVAACHEIVEYFHPGMLVILESTTYPGTTDEVLLPMLTKSGLEAGKDFFLCFSPERVDPGNPKFHTNNIPKVVGGVTPACTEMGRLFYSQALQKVVPVSSTQVAEMVKLLENTFRMINIGLANEIALMCDRIGVNVWEVIDAAATKPFGFMPFYPGPGLGGHCIPIDPFYLSWKTKQAGIEARFIELAGYINGQMPHFVVDKVQNALNNVGKPVKNSLIHILGVAYKRDIADVRESPALDIALLLQKRGARLTYSDPHVPELRLDGATFQAQPESAAAAADCVVIVTDHSAFDYQALVERAQLIVDSRNALKAFQSDKIVRL